jgi:hypothetical protein
MQSRFSALGCARGRPRRFVSEVRVIARKIWTLGDLPEPHRRRAEAQLIKVVNHIAEATEKVQERPSKLRNVRCQNEAGERFDSKLERRHCAALRAAHGPAAIIRQVSLPVGLQRVRPDFLVIHEVLADGTFRGEFLDAKGHATADWTSKARKLQILHGITIRILT